MVRKCLSLCFITIRELLDRPTDPMAVRLFVLQAQYRKPIDFTDEAVFSANNGWNTLKGYFWLPVRFPAGWESRGAEDLRLPQIPHLSSLSLPLPEVVSAFKRQDDDLNFSWVSNFV